MTLRPGPARMAVEGGRALGEVLSAQPIILENAPSPSPHHMGAGRCQAFYLPYLSTLMMGLVEKPAPSYGPVPSGDARAPPTARVPGHQTKREEQGLIDEIRNLELAEAQLSAFIDRQAAKSKEARAGQDAANEEEDRQRARDARRTHAVRLVHARAWVAFHGAQALRHHDLAAQAAQKRDEYAAIVHELERTTERKTA